MSDEPGWTSPSWDPTHPEAGGAPQPPQPPQYPPPPGSGPPPAQPPPPQYQPPQYQPPQYPPPPPGYQQYAYQQQYQTPKPGIIPLRPLGVGEILDGAITVVRKHWKIMMGLSAAVVAVTSLIQFVFQVTLLRDASSPFSFSSSSSFDNGFDSTSSQTQLSAGSGLGVLGFFGTTLLNWIAITVLSGLFTVVVSQAVLGQQVTLADAWARVRPRIWGLIGLSVMSGIFLVLGFALCIIPGVFLYVALSVASPALVLERAGVFGSMGRSRRLVQGSWWRGAGILILAAVITAVISFVVEIPFLILGGGSIFLSARSGDVSDGSFVFLQACLTVAAIIAGAITYPFTAAIRALFYVDLRMRKEGLDIELTRAAAAATTAGPAGPAGPQYGQPPT